jgi:hypothetical protein
MKRAVLACFANSAAPYLRGLQQSSANASVNARQRQQPHGHSQYKGVEYTIVNLDSSKSYAESLVDPFDARINASQCELENETNNKNKNGFY